MSSTNTLIAEASSGLLPTTPRDRYFDYCLEPYRPRRPPEGKWRAENLLWHSLETQGCAEAFRAPLEAIQREVGRDMTVWGIKVAQGKVWWELYFYDPQKEHPGSAISAVAKTLSEWLTIEPHVPETVPYMMVSFDLQPDSMARGTVPLLNLYLTGQAEHAGRSFSVTPEATELQNTYRFMGPKADVDVMLPLLKSSVWVDYSEPRILSQIVPPELFACKRVCVSKKRHCDAVYFSGISVEQLLWFMNHFDYPEELRSFVETHKEGFEHIFFDVGIDYLQGPDGELVIPKTSYYGTI